jgi:hypothetical protein
MEKINKIEFWAREWFQKSYGNSYHNVKVYVNDKYIGQSGYTYGYGDQYEQSGKEVLKENGYLKDKGFFQSIYTYCRNNDIEFVRGITAVKREKDLKDFINQKG